MRIREIHIDRFGPFNDRSIVGLSPALNVLHGPNEAGKSAIRAFVRYVMFGYLDGRSTADSQSLFRYESLSGTAPQGRLVVESDIGAQSIILERQGTVRGGSLTINGASAPSIGTLTGGIDEKLFHEVFSISLSEFQTLRAMSDEAEAVFSAGMGISTDLPRVRRKIEEDAGRLLSPRSGAIRESYRSIEAARSELREAAQQPRRYIEVEQELEGLGEVSNQRIDEISSLEERKRFLSSVEELRPHLEQMRQTEAQIAELPRLDGMPDDAAARFDQLLRDNRNDRQRIDETDSEHDEAGLKERAGEIAPDWDLDALRDGPLSAQLKTHLVELAKRVGEKRGEVNEVQARLQSTQETVNDARMQMERIENVSDRRAEDIDSTLRDLRRLNLLIQGTNDLEDRYDNARTIAGIRDQEGQEATDAVSQAPPPGTVPAVGGFILGLLAAVAFIANIWADMTWLDFVAAGALVVALLVAAGGIISSRASQPIDAASPGKEERDANIVDLENRLQKARRDAEQTSKECGFESSPYRADVLKRIDELQSQLNVRQNYEAREETKRNADSRLEADERSLMNAQSALRAAREEWAGSVSELGIDIELSPERTEAVLTEIESLQSECSELDRWQKRRASIEATIEDRKNEAVLLLKRAGLSGDIHADAEGFLRVVKGNDERIELEKELSVKRMAQPRLVNDEGEPYRKRIEESSSEENAAEIDRLGRDLEVLTQERDENQIRIGELRGEKSEIERSARVTELRQRIVENQARMQSDVEEWAVLKLADKFLNDTVAMFQRERQPDTIKAASSYFGKITDGRYKVEQDIVGDGAASTSDNLRVLDESAIAKDVARLSRGTREQLYLAMRMAYIDDHVRRSTPIPVIMDDVIVNFDRDRSVAACRAIVDLAQKCQVIFLTCHEHTLEVLRDAAEGYETDANGLLVEIDLGLMR